MSDVEATDRGTIVEEDGRRRVHFERTYEAAPEQVWAALTRPERLARWLTISSIEPRVGGRIEHDFGDEGVCGGQILVWEPPRVLEYEWHFPQEPASTVRFELREQQDGTTSLVLDHRQLGADHATGYGAGWHAHLDALAAEVMGRDPGDWDQRFAEVLPHYRS